MLNGGGAMLGLEEELLGATVLAWGETLPDLVAMLAVARAGACAAWKFDFPESSGT